MKSISQRQKYADEVVCKINAYIKVSISSICHVLPAVFAERAHARAHANDIGRYTTNVYIGGSVHGLVLATLSLAVVATTDILSPGAF